MLQEVLKTIGGYAIFSLSATVQVNKTKKALIDHGMHALLKPDIAC
jgi:hypothetical protein